MLGLADEPKQTRAFLSSIGGGKFPPCAVPRPSNTKQSTHHLDAELIPMCIDELARPSGLAGDLAYDKVGSLGYSRNSLCPRSLGTPPDVMAERHGIVIRMSIGIRYGVSTPDAW
jgi:hypothetical protein